MCLDPNSHDRAIRHKFEECEDDTAIGKFPVLPIAYNDLKSDLRSGLTADARLYWWPLLPRVLSGTTITSYPDIKDIAAKRYKWAKEQEIGTSKSEHTEIHDIQSDRCEEIMTLLIKMHDLEEPGLIKPLVNILVLMMPNIDICFQTCCDILARPDWFISPTAVNHRLKLFTFKELVKKYMPKEFNTLDRIGALGAEYLNLIFIDLFSSLLPMPDVARIMDSFLLEGLKILHRYGLGLIHMHRDFLHSSVCCSGRQFWEEVRNRCHTSLNFNDLSVSAFTLGRSAFSLVTGGGFSLRRKSIGKYEGRGRVALGESARLPLNLGLMRGRGKATVRGVDAVSKIIDKPAAARLRMFLPESSNMEGFRLVFATYRDGWSLDTLYTRTAGMYPCIIVIRSLQQRVVVGAFVPVPISPPSNDIRGNGTAFVFRLSGDTSACYRWEPMQGSDRQDGTLSAAHAQFALCATDYIIVGGSAFHGTNALRIDSELKTCYSGPSDTYGNPPLAPEERIQPFVIGDLEILCGESSAERTIRGDAYQKASWNSEKASHGASTFSLLHRKSDSHSIECDNDGGSC